MVILLYTYVNTYTELFKFLLNIKAKILGNFILSKKAKTVTVT